MNRSLLTCSDLISARVGVDGNKSVGLSVKITPPLPLLGGSPLLGTANHGMPPLAEARASRIADNLRWRPDGMDSHD